MSRGSDWSSPLGPELSSAASIEADVSAQLERRVLVTEDGFEVLTDDVPLLR